MKKDSGKEEKDWGSSRDDGQLMAHLCALSVVLWQLHYFADSAFTLLDRAMMAAGFTEGIEPMALTNPYIDVAAAQAQMQEALDKTLGHVTHDFAVAQEDWHEEAEEEEDVSSTAGPSSGPACGIPAPRTPSPHPPAMSPPPLPNIPVPDISKCMSEQDAWWEYEENRKRRKHKRPMAMRSDDATAAATAKKLKGSVGVQVAWGEARNQSMMPIPPPPPGPPPADAELVPPWRRPRAPPPLLAKAMPAYTNPLHRPAPRK